MKQNNLEMEKKFLITSEGTFKEILVFIRSLETINNYTIEGFFYKTREYRYFDTFEGKLAEEKILTCVGPLEKVGASASIRPRETDYVLTIKFPTDDPALREENEHKFPLSSEIDFYQINPEKFDFWAPLIKVKKIGGGKLLQEAIKLEVQSTRFDLYSDNGKRIEIALDDVLGIGPFNLRAKFYELEVESKSNSNKDDLEKVTTFFVGKYQSNLKENSLPKWIKALKLIRGETLY